MNGRSSHLMLLLLPFCLLTPVAVLAQHAILLNDSVDVYRIGKFTESLHDPTGNLTIDSVTRGSASRRFVESNFNQNNFGWTADAIWIKFTADNMSTGNTEWLLSEDYAIIDTAAFYAPLGDGKFQRIVVGTAFPMKVRPVKSRLIVFPIYLKPSESKTYYLRFRSNSSLPIYLKISRHFAFSDNESGRSLFFGFFYGALLIMAFYNLFLFFTIRDVSYLYYFLYAIMMGYYQFCMDGLRYRYLFPDTPILVNVDIASAIWLGGAFWILFAREFLEIGKYSKTFDGVYRVSAGTFFAGFVYTALFPGRLGYMLSTPLWLVALALNVAAGVYCLKKGNANAIIYLIAVAVFAIGVPLRAFRVLGIEQASFLSRSAFQLGILAEMTILSFALGNRINRIRQESEMEKAMVRSRIASDLHDEIGSSLSSISVASQMVIGHANLSDDEKRRLEDITITARETAESIRDIIWFINPEHDKSEDMILRMKDTASKLLQGIQCTFECVECRMIKAKDLQFRRNFFLIYKEILNNVVKHSMASRVDIRMEEDSKGFRLEVVDNGVGFDERKIDPRHGDGIKNLRRRAREIGCDLGIYSRPGKGTTVALVMKEP